MPIAPTIEDVKLKNDDFVKNWGGYRSGAGRKIRLTFEVRDLFNRAIDEYWDMIVGQIIKYAREGDKDMLKYILDQRIGKAPMSLSVDNKGKGMTFIKIENVQNNLTLDAEDSEISETEMVHLAPINLEKQKEIGTSDNLLSQNRYCATTGDDHSPPLSKGEALRAAHERLAILQRNSGGAQEVIHTPPPPETETMS